MALLQPTQKISINPYDSNRWSSVINRMHRIVTGGRDVILKPDESFTLSISDEPANPEYPDSSVTISAGICVKDDVLIHITEDYKLDFTDRLVYVDPSDEDENMFNSTGYYIIVLEYTYSRSLPSPIAFFRIIKDIDIYTTYTDNYLFIGTALVSYDVDEERYYIGTVFESHPGVMPPIERVILSGGVPLEVDGGYLNPED